MAELDVFDNTGSVNIYKVRHRIRRIRVSVTRPFIVERTPLVMFLIIDLWLCMVSKAY